MAPAAAESTTTPQGPVTLVGETGATGPRGETGANGAIGERGPPGPSAAVGTAAATTPTIVGLIIWVSIVTFVLLIVVIVVGVVAVTSSRRVADAADDDDEGCVRRRRHRPRRDDEFQPTTPTSSTTDLLKERSAEQKATTTANGAAALVAVQNPYDNVVPVAKSTSSFAADFGVDGDINTELRFVPGKHCGYGGGGFGDAEDWDGDESQLRQETESQFSLGTATLDEADLEAAPKKVDAAAVVRTESTTRYEYYNGPGQYDLVTLEQSATTTKKKDDGVEPRTKTNEVVYY
jgi:hypothetical protein